MGRPNLDPGWFERAACRGRGTGMFFAEPGSRRGQALLTDRIAKRRCVQCPVRRECLEKALYDELALHVAYVWDKGKQWPMVRVYRYDTWGIWGGTTRQERDDTRHVSGCETRTCRGCRPIPERIEMLMAEFLIQANKLLASGEEAA